VPVGEAAIYVVACAIHRAAALAMIGDFMDRLKQDVPIWKIRALDATGLELPSSS
jgi:molybdopterin synthase catalytic subunit